MQDLSKCSKEARYIQAGQSLRRLESGSLAFNFYQMKERLAKVNKMTIITRKNGCKSEDFLNYEKIFRS